MWRDVVRQHQDRRLAGTHEGACHGEHEVCVGEVHLLQEGIDRGQSDLGSAGNERRSPALHVVVVELVGHLRPMTGGLRKHGGNDPVGRPFQQVPDEGAADAVAQHHELFDAEVVHQTEVVVCVGVPRPVDLERTRRLSAGSVAQVRGYTAVAVLERFHRVERVRGGEAGDRGIQTTAGNDQQRKACSGLLVMNADGAFFVDRHASSPCAEWCHATGGASTGLNVCRSLDAKAVRERPRAPARRAPHAGHCRSRYASG